MATNWDYSNILLSDRRGANLANGLQQGVQAFGRGVAAYYENKQRQEKEEATIDWLNQNEDAVNQLFPQLANVTDPAERKKVLKAGIKGAGLENLVQMQGFLSNERRADATHTQSTQLRDLQIEREKAAASERARQMDEIAGINQRADSTLAKAATTGILKPEAMMKARRFAESPAGQLRSQGVTLTPEMMMQTAATQPFSPQEMMTPSGLPMVQTSPKSWIPDPRVRLPSSKDATTKIKVGNQEFIVGPGNRYFDAKTGAPVNFKGNTAQLGVFEKGEREALPAQIAKLEKEITATANKVKTGNKRPGPDWLPVAKRYEDKLTELQSRLREKQNRLRELGGEVDDNEEDDAGERYVPSRSIADPVAYVFGS